MTPYSNRWSFSSLLSLLPRFTLLPVMVVSVLSFLSWHLDYFKLYPPTLNSCFTHDEAVGTDALFLLLLPPPIALLF